jgi:hypothetical protein
MEEVAREELQNAAGLIDRFTGLVASRGIKLESPALENILYSLNFLAQYECLNFLIERYDLENARTRLLESSEAKKRR